LLVIFYLLWIEALSIEAADLKSPQKTYLLSVKDRQITLKAENAPLNPIFKELSNRLKIRIRIIGSVQGKVTGHIENASIESFLKRVAISYAVVTDGHRQQLKVIYVIPQAEISLQDDREDGRASNQIAPKEFIVIAPVAVINAAHAGLKRFMVAAIHDNPSLYGFSNMADIEDAMLDDPFNVYTIDPNTIVSANGSNSFQSIVVPTSQWFFPVMGKDGTYRSILSVDRVHGEWQATSFGSSGLATQLERFVDRWGALQNRQVKFVRVYQALSDIIAIQQGNSSIIYPLPSAWQALGLDERDVSNNLYPSNEIIDALQETIKNHRARFLKR
jgi:hypothetical protein